MEAVITGQRLTGHEFFQGIVIPQTVTNGVLPRQRETQGSTTFQNGEAAVSFASDISRAIDAMQAGTIIILHNGRATLKALFYY